MATYASLLSLGHLLNQLSQHPPRQRAVFDNVQIESLLDNINFLQEFLEEFSLIRGDDVQALEEKIARSAYAAEDIIESRVADQILEDSEEESESNSTRDLQKVIEEFDTVKQDVMKIKKTEGIKIMEQPRKAVDVGSIVTGASDCNNTMVGFDEDLKQIIDTLTGDDSNLQILSVVGMGGIGKTTLAKNVFHNPIIIRHFDICAWATISQQNSVHEILSGLLEDIEGEKITPKNDHELGLRLHRSLFDRRYLIVMDDMWSIEVWDAIRRFLPDNNNGSRVMVTTRLSNVAHNFCSCIPHQLHLLDEDQSWALFSDKVFGKESCPPELEEVGKKIVRNCKGLPLAIAAISGILAKSSRTVGYWEYVSIDTYDALNMGGDGLCLEILSLSYKHLPVHLKPCFLYMAIFPEDHEIRISRLLKLWVAEGILKPIQSRSLEEIAEDNLKDLIDRNLIMIDKYGSANTIRSCTIHDLIRDLCLREAQKEKFLSVAMMHSLNNQNRIIDDDRQLVIRQSSNKELKSTYTKMHELLRVLDISREEVVRLVNSRYIDFHTAVCPYLFNLFESLSLIWNLQTVIVWDFFNETLSLPAEICEMAQLRHLKCEGEFYLPDPPSTSSKNGSRDVLKNLQTLYKIRNFRCTDKVVVRVPNLKKLGVTYREFPSGFVWDYYEVYNLAHFRNLESLSFESEVNEPPNNLCFPRSLKKLTLRICGLCWEDLTVVGSLPHLEVLKLRDYAVIGRQWSPVEGQFLQLKSLRIDFANLVEWIADSSHFPSLEKLELRFAEYLKEIPYGIGEIQTLRSISLAYCSASVNSSVEKIQEEQQNLGNYDLQVQVTRWT